MSEKSLDTHEPTKVGLSLSMCVGDVLSGKVELDDIKKIVSSTAAKNAEDWDQVIKSYRENYWGIDPDRGEEIARSLIASGRVEQPRLNGGQANNILEGHWLPK